jgi:hypothetical protein
VSATVFFADELPEHVYHAHPALSSSGARLLLDPGCPALYRWRRDNPPPPRSVFDFGHAAHAKILGVGAGVLVPVDADLQPYAEWRTADAKAQVAQAREDGLIPLKEPDAQAAADMAGAVLRHPIAGRLLTAPGQSEVSIFWTDDETGVECRARIDRLPDDPHLPIVDYKTTTCAHPVKFRRSAADYGYHQQDPFYRDAVGAAGLGERGFAFICQEKDPPYLVSVVQLDGDDVALGAARNRRAREVLAECLATDTWPGYGDDEIVTLRLPAWVSA